MGQFYLWFKWSRMPLKEIFRHAHEQQEHCTALYSLLDSVLWRSVAYSVVLKGSEHSAVLCSALAAHAHVEHNLVAGKEARYRTTQNNAANVCSVDRFDECSWKTVHTGQYMKRNRGAQRSVGLTQSRYSISIYSIPIDASSADWTTLQYTTLHRGGGRGF